MTIAAALLTLLDVVARDSEARCAEIIGAARAEAGALAATAIREQRQRLRIGLNAARANAAERMAAAHAQLESEQRRATQRRASLAAAAAEAQLPAALRALWADPAQRRQWLQQALACAAQSLPRGTWHIRHAPDLGADDKAWLQQRLDELGVASASFEADAGIEAGLEIQVGAARLEATPAGLLADRAWVCGRLLQLMEDAPASPAAPRSGEHPLPPCLGQGTGGKVAS